MRERHIPREAIAVYESYSWKFVPYWAVQETSVGVDKSARIWSLMLRQGSARLTRCDLESCAALRCRKGSQVTVGNPARRGQPKQKIHRRKANSGHRAVGMAVAQLDGAVPLSGRLRCVHCRERQLDKSTAAMGSCLTGFRLVARRANSAIVAVVSVERSAVSW